MRVYLVQHAEARPKSEDPDRNLSDRGIADARKMAAFLKPLAISVRAVWHSGKARAEATATHLAEGVEADEGVVQHSGLKPNDSVEPIRDELEKMDKDVMIVGHLPFVNRLVSLLAAGSDSADIAAYQPGGIVCLARGESGPWQIQWMAVPDLM